MPTRMIGVCGSSAGRCANAIFRGFPLVFLGIFTASLASSGTFRQDEVECEEAVAYLDDCCPGFDARSQLRCAYMEREGCGESTLPDLSVDESGCIRDMSCAEIRERGLCEIRGTTGRDGERVLGFDGGAICQ